jgi:sortase A
VDSDIETMAILGSEWGISEKKANYLHRSGVPGKGGNIILYGHNTREILGNIRALKGGEIVTLTTKEGARYKYRVATFQEVPPSKVNLLQPTTEEVLTMYTCSGLLDSMRFVVRAIPLQ